VKENQQKKISIITVCFNSQETVALTIKSVLAQFYRNFELIIVDGKSSDRTVECIKKFKDPRILLISERDNGIYDAMNKGIKRATGDIIGILNSDDFYVGAYVLKEVIDAFSRYPNTDVVLGNVDYVKSESLRRPVRKYTANKFEAWKLRFGIMPPHPAMFIKSKVYQKIGLYKTDYKIAADFELCVRIFLVSKLRFFSTKNLWVTMRVGGVSTSGLKSHITSTFEIKRSLKANDIYSNYFFILLRLPIKFFSEIEFFAIFRFKKK
tara:strand:- start:3026 stop:3823 length:798 start_codon:yes stop_codon:yes gene_type:complete